MKVKPFLTYGIAVLLLIGFVFVFYHAFKGVIQPVTTTESFSEALWEMWGVTIVIVSFIIFAGGIGILVLLGGGWRWE
ncbi:Uncharacterised protein [uncultured archaeon]|nr:Uncharacterised protein [uncultured archaeon]